MQVYNDTTEKDEEPLWVEKQSMDKTLGCLTGAERSSPEGEVQQVLEALRRPGEFGGST